MVIRSRLPKERDRGMGSKVMDGLGKFGKMYWDSIPVDKEPSFENTSKSSNQE